jgi:aerobic carbon-monoxide dehydrogenase medium subunit
MKPVSFGYHAPRSIDETLALLAEHGEDGKILAGGQSLVPLLNMRLAVPAVLIDISRVADLRGTAQVNGGIRYGASIVHSAFEDRRVPDPTGGLLHLAARGIGYRAIRNRGTLGGSLAHADSSAEWPVLMAAVDARVTLRSARGDRRIPARTLVTGYFTSDIASDELLTSVDVPPIDRATRWGFHKASRKPGEFAESLAVCLVRSTGTEIWIGAAGGTPVPVDLPFVSTADDWSRVDRGGVLAAVADAVAGADTNPAAEDRYRRHLHGMAACTALERALTPEMQP